MYLKYGDLVVSDETNRWSMPSTVHHDLWSCFCFNFLETTVHYFLQQDVKQRHFPGEVKGEGKKRLIFHICHYLSFIHAKMNRLILTKQMAPDGRGLEVDDLSQAQAGLQCQHSTTVQAITTLQRAKWITFYTILRVLLIFVHPPLFPGCCWIN